MDLPQFPLLCKLKLLSLDQGQCCFSKVEMYVLPIEEI